MKSVYLKKINSFTYLELLFVLLVISIICALIPILIKSVSTFNKIADFDDAELIYLAKDLTDDQVVHNAKYVSINDVRNTLTLKQGNQIITYRFRNNKLIKTVNHSGNI
ncbi:type II secretion system protein, partial [Staphylococcus gallinarum]